MDALVSSAMVWTESRKGFWDGRFDQTPLEFVGERTGRQSQRPVQGKDAGRAGAEVAHAEEFDGSNTVVRARVPSRRWREQFAVLLPEV